MKCYTKFLFIISISISFLKADVFVEMSNDTVEVWDTKAWEHCGMEVEFLVDISNDTITVVEHDTMTDWTTCMCYHDFSVTLIGLDAGTYHVEIFRKYSVPYMVVDSLYYIGSTDFNYEPVSQNDYNESYYQSGCYHLNDMEEETAIIENMRLISIYPNPFNSSTIIKYFIEDKADVNISVFDIQGKLIDVIENKMQVSGYNELVWKPLNIPSGLYIFKISSNGKSQTQKVLFIK